jgi:hypothetical protein
MRIWIIGIVPVFLLFGPVPASADVTVPDIAPAVVPIYGQLGKVSVVPAGASLEIYPIAPAVEPVLRHWEAALQTALTRTAIFRGGASAPLSLQVTVMEFARSGDTLIVFARYRLHQQGAPEPIFSADIMTDAGITSTDNGINTLVDSARIVQNPEQVKQAVRSNIAEFVDRLEAFAKNQKQLAARVG